MIATRIGLVWKTGTTRDASSRESTQNMSVRDTPCRRPTPSPPRMTVTSVSGSGLMSRIASEKRPWLVPTNRLKLRTPTLKPLSTCLSTRVMNEKRTGLARAGAIQLIMLIHGLGPDCRTRHRRRVYARATPPRLGPPVVHPFITLC